MSILKHCTVKYDTIDLAGPYCYPLLFTAVDLLPTEPSAFPGVCPEDTEKTEKQYFWIPHKGYCYQFVMHLMFW